MLLRNNEWDYAREFITMSSVLDDERREAFLQALQSLYEEQQDSERREREEKARQEDQLRRDLEEARRLRAENEAIERKRLEEERAKRERGASEVDYGIEKSPGPKAGSANGSSRGARQPRDRAANGSARGPLSSSSKKGKAVAPKPSFAGRAVLVFSNIRALLQQMGSSFQSNPYLLMRMIAFILGFLLVVSRKSIRDRIRRALGTSWDKIRATAGMGVKVSYI